MYDHLIPHNDVQHNSTVCWLRVDVALGFM